MPNIFSRAQNDADQISRAERKEIQRRQRETEEKQRKAIRVSMQKLQNVMTEEIHKGHDPKKQTYRLGAEMGWRYSKPEEYVKQMNKKLAKEKTGFACRYVDYSAGRRGYYEIGPSSEIAAKERAQVQHRTTAPITSTSTTTSSQRRDRSRYSSTDIGPADGAWMLGGTTSAGCRGPGYYGSSALVHQGWGMQDRVTSAGCSHGSRALANPCDIMHPERRAEFSSGAPAGMPAFGPTSVVTPLTYQGRYRELELGKTSDDGQLRADVQVGRPLIFR